MENTFNDAGEIPPKSQYEGFLRNGQTIWARCITGEVISKAQAEASFRINDQGYNSSNRHKSDAKPHESTDLYLIGSDESLRHIDCHTLGIRVDIGDRLTVTWGNLDDSESAPLWHIVNHTQDETYTFLEGAPFRRGWKPPKPPAGYRRYIVATTLFLYLLSLLGGASIRNLDWMIWLSSCIAVYIYTRRKFISDCRYAVSRFFLAIIAAEQEDRNTKAACVHY